MPLEGNWQIYHSFNIFDLKDSSPFIPQGFGLLRSE